jgi:hypothetical protein
LLRKAKRINSNVRARYATFAGRQANRADYIKYLTTNPFRVEMFERLITHIRGILRNEALVERDVLARGFF